MFSNWLESVKARSFQAVEAYCNFDRIKAVYKTLRLWREEKLYVMERISRSRFNGRVYK
jgi:hypothetical protein